ncbi:MAG: hypothetical protein ACFFE4_02320 [Candidatus Thorarchaeota archaeon]
MVNEDFHSIKDIESELYALINTVLNADEKFEEGIINANFFRRTVKNAIKELLEFNIFLKEEKVDLSQLLKKMNFTEQYYNAISIINGLSKGDNKITPSHFKDKISPVVLELPGITLEITSSFITLMDALKLKGFKEKELIDNLFIELITNLKKFPGLDNLRRDIKIIYGNCLPKPQYEVENIKSSEDVVDEIYHVFKQFHRKLNLKD